MRAFISGAAALAAATALSTAGQAAVLYDNGPINGTINAWTINFSFAVSDSFTVAANSTVTGVSFGAWNFPGDTISSVDWAISTAPFGGTFVTAGTADVFQFSNGFGADVYSDSFSAGGALTAGTTYWLTLENAVATNGDPAFWDENDGPSQALENTVGPIGSESFQILGTAGTVPEPATWGLMLIGFGLVGGAVRASAKRSAVAA